MKFILAFAMALTSLATASAITIDTVPVGDVGNPKDPGTYDLYGSVGHAYEIGKYEVTVGEYTEFLNAVAKTDTYKLYSTKMGTDPWVAGIARSGVSGNYTYNVIGSPKHPATYVDWGDAVRFVNWLHNGQPIGLQNSATTEDGAYTLNGTMWYENVQRNTQARLFLPSDDEWYKAAYYQPASNGGDVDGYWKFPLARIARHTRINPRGQLPTTHLSGIFICLTD